MRRLTLFAAALALVASCKPAGKEPDPGPGPGSGTAPALALSAARLSFSAAGGVAGPPSQSFTVSNAGGGTLAAPTAEVSYASGAGWISAAAVTGAAAPYTVTVEIASGALAPGTYQASIALASAGAGNGPLTVAVELTVDAPPSMPLLELGSTGLAFQAEEGGAAPAAQTFTASNAGSGALVAPTADITYQSGTGWISAATVSGSAAPYEVRVEVSPAGLAAGTYQATLAVASAGAGNGPLSLPVELTVKAHRASMSASGSLSFYPRSLGASDPTPQALTISAFGEGSLARPTATVLYDSGSGWVKSVEVAGSAPPYTVTVAPTLAGLGAGTYRGRIRLESEGSPNSPLDYPVRIGVLGQATLQLGAETVTFAGLAGGASPAAHAFVAGGVVGTPVVLGVDYLGGPGGWLAASSTVNLWPTVITFTPSTTGLAAGTYRAEVSVAADGLLGSPRTVPVSLVLTDPAGPAMAANPASVTFATPQGTSPAAATVSIGQSGAGALPAPTAAVNYVVGSGWLTASISGSAPPYTLTLTPSSAALPLGQYKANVVLLSSPASNSPVIVPVVLRVMRRVQINTLCTSWFHDGQKQHAGCPDTYFTVGGVSDTVVGSYYPTITWTSTGVGWFDLPAGDAITVTRYEGTRRSSLYSAASTLDLGSDGAGWPYPVWTGATNNVTWQLSGLSPWQPGADSVLFHSWDAGFSDAERPTAAAGAASLSTTIDFGTKGLPMLRSRDDVNALQLRSFDTPRGGASYQGVVAAWSTSGIQMSYGVPATVVPPVLPPPSAASSLAAEWRHSQFQEGLPPATGPLPAGHELSIVAVPAPLTVPSPFRQGQGLPLLALQRVGGALADADYGTLSYQRFLGAGWHHYRFAGYVAPVNRAAPGATPVDFLAYVARYDDADTATGPIVPLVTGARAITVNGADAMQPLSGVSGWASVSFDWPAIGGDAAYWVTVYALTSSAGKTVVTAGETTRDGASFYAQPGNAYVVGVQMIQGPANPESAPWREGVPLGVSQVYSAVITP